MLSPRSLTAVTLLASLALLSACSSSDKAKVTGPDGKGGAGGDSSTGTSADWTMLGYDLSSNYWNKAETKVTVDNVASWTKAWEFDTQAGVSSTPIIADGKVFFAGQGLTAINLSDASVVWNKPDIGGSSSVAVVDGVLYFHDSASKVWALDPATGDEVWHHDPEADGLIGFSSVTVTKDYVLVGASGLEEVQLPAGQDAVTRGFVLALNRKDGTTAWKKFTVEPGSPSAGVGIWSTISVDEASSTVVAGTGNTYTGPAMDTSDAFLGLNLKDGSGDFLFKPQIFKGDVFTSATAAKGSPDADFGANPVLAEVGGKKIALGGNKGGDVWVIDRTDGSIIQQRTLGKPNAFKGGIFVNGAFDGTHFLVACNGPTTENPAAVSTLYGLDPLTLEVAWSKPLTGSVFGMITTANGVGFVGVDKTLQAFDVTTGDTIAEFPTEATIATAPAVSNGYIIFGSGMSWLTATAGSKYYALKVP